MSKELIVSSTAHETKVAVLESDELQLPHPLLHERAFVLVPLNDIAPDLMHPTLSMTVGELLGQLPDAERRKVWPIQPA